jgi:carboxypeptidase family protein
MSHSDRASCPIRDSVVARRAFFAGFATIWLAACGGGPRLQVSVLDQTGTSSAPLQGAQVQIAQAENTALGAAAERTTGPTGKIEFSKLKAGLYSIRVTKAGYSSSEVSARVPDKKQVQVSLQQVFSVHGSVLFPDGKPVQDAIVFFLAQGTNQQKTATMSGSEYEIDGLPAAIYEVRAGTKDRLYSITLDQFVLQQNENRDLVLDEMPPQFDMPEDEPLAPPSASGRGRVPKQ